MFFCFSLSLIIAGLNDTVKKINYSSIY